MTDTPKRPVTKTIGSVTFTDPFDWLQHDSPEAMEWMWARDEEAQAAVRANPLYPALREAIASGATQVRDLMTTPPRLLRGRWLRAMPTPKSPLRALWVSDRADDPGRVLVEAADMAGPDDDVASSGIQWFEVSPNGKRVACAIVSGGRMTGQWRIVDVDTGRVLPFSTHCTAYSGALPGWLPDGSGFYLFDREADGRHNVRFHPIDAGVASRAGQVFDDGLIPTNVSGVTIELSPDGRRAIALAGPHERIALALGDLATNSWRRFLPPDVHGECQGVWINDETYLARVHDEETPRGRIVEIPVATSQDASTWRERVPQSRSTLKAVSMVDDHIVAAEVLDCAVRFRVFRRDGTGERVVPLAGPGTSLIAMLYRRFDRSEAFTFDFGSFIQSSATYRCDPRTLATTPLGPVKVVEGIRVSQQFATSIDGTLVPYFLVHRADLDLTRPQPALITGYGGFNVSLMPTPLGHLLPFVQAGGAFIHANLRGGGEYGKQWHDSGRLACKWNTFADLFAVAEKVIADGITTPARFAMTGASNGGLLAGAAIAHRPELWRAVVPVVPLFDQLEPLPPDPKFDAVRAIFFEDYGQPSHPVMSKVLLSYSPYHNVRQATAYPAIFQVFGEHDVGCMPFHGRKFTAALREATSSGLPVHLRVWKNTGHGAAEPEAAASQPAEWLAFVMQHLGMTYPPAP